MELILNTVYQKDYQIFRNIYDEIGIYMFITNTLINIKYLQQLLNIINPPSYNIETEYNELSNLILQYLKIFNDVNNIITTHKGIIDKKLKISIIQNIRTNTSIYKSLNAIYKDINDLIGKYVSNATPSNYNTFINKLNNFNNSTINNINDAEINKLITALLSLIENTNSNKLSFLVPHKIIRHVQHIYRQNKIPFDMQYKIYFILKKISLKIKYIIDITSHFKHNITI